MARPLPSGGRGAQKCRRQGFIPGLPAAAAKRQHGRPVKEVTTAYRLTQPRQGRDHWDCRDGWEARSSWMWGLRFARRQLTGHGLVDGYVMLSADTTRVMVGVFLGLCFVTGLIRNTLRRR